MTTTKLKTADRSDARLLDLGALLDLAIANERKLWVLVDAQPDHLGRDESAIYASIIAPVSALVDAILAAEPHTTQGWMVQARALQIRGVGINEDMPIAA